MSELDIIIIQSSNLKHFLIYFDKDKRQNNVYNFVEMYEFVGIAMSSDIVWLFAEENLSYFIIRNTRH